MEPVADGASALLASWWPVFEAEVRQLVGFDTKRIYDNPGGAAGVVAFDCLLEKVCLSHAAPHCLSLAPND